MPVQAPPAAPSGTPQVRGHDRAGQIVGSIMMVMGVLTMLLSGLCTGLLLVGNGASKTWQQILDVLPLAAIFGGVPMIVGVAMVIGGRVLYRSATHRR